MWKQLQRKLSGDIFHSSKYDGAPISLEKKLKDSGYWPDDSPQYRDFKKGIMDYDSDIGSVQARKIRFIARARFSVRQFLDTWNKIESGSPAEELIKSNHNNRLHTLWNDFKSAEKKQGGEIKTENIPPEKNTPTNIWTDLPERSPSLQQFLKSKLIWDDLQKIPNLEQGIIDFDNNVNSVFAKNIQMLIDYNIDPLAWGNSHVREIMDSPKDKVVLGYTDLEEFLKWPLIDTWPIDKDKFSYQNYLGTTFDKLPSDLQTGLKKIDAGYFKNEVSKDLIIHGLDFLLKNHHAAWKHCWEKEWAEEASKFRDKIERICKNTYPAVWYELPQDLKDGIIDVNLMINSPLARKVIGLKMMLVPADKLAKQWQKKLIYKLENTLEENDLFSFPFHNKQPKRDYTPKKISSYEPLFRNGVFSGLFAGTTLPLLYKAGEIFLHNVGTGPIVANSNNNFTLGLTTAGVLSAIFAGTAAYKARNFQTSFPIQRFAINLTLAAAFTVAMTTIALRENKPVNENYMQNSNATELALNNNP